MPRDVQVGGEDDDGIGLVVSGKWKVGSGEWGVASGELALQFGDHFTKYPEY